MGKTTKKIKPVKLKKSKKLKIKFNRSGLPYIKRPKANKAEILVQTHEDGIFTIEGNKIGLRLLAKAAFALSALDKGLTEQGYHVHLDDLYNKLDCHLIIRRR